MSHYDLAPDLSTNAQQVLTTLLESGDSQAVGVADCLNTIAENGPDSASDHSLTACAKEIKDWADWVINELHPTQTGAITKKPT